MIYAGVPPKERARAVRALEMVGLGDRLHHKPSEVSEVRQRASIARAIVNRPAIVLADEPTGNLDSVTGTEIMELFDELNANGNTIILVTHERDVAEHASRHPYLRWASRSWKYAPGERQRCAGREAVDVNLIEFFKIALGSLSTNKLRTALSLLGIIIGVASVITWYPSAPVPRSR